MTASEEEEEAIWASYNIGFVVNTWEQKSDLAYKISA
jgi:hypothetical protein